MVAKVDETSLFKLMMPNKRVTPNQRHIFIVESVS